MAGDKRSGGGVGALTNLTRRGRGDKVGRDLKPSRRCHHRHGSAVAAGPTYPLFVYTEAALKQIDQRWWCALRIHAGKTPACLHVEMHVEEGLWSHFE